MLRKIRITSWLLLLLSVCCAYKSGSVLNAGAHLGSPLAQACLLYIVPASASSDSGAEMLKDGCAIAQKQIANIGHANFDAFAWLLAISAILFVWGLALLLWSRRMANQTL